MQNTPIIKTTDEALAFLATLPDVEINGRFVVVRKTCARCDGTGYYLRGTCFACKGINPKSTTMVPLLDYARKLRTTAMAKARRDAVLVAKATAAENARKAAADAYRAANSVVVAALAVDPKHKILADLAAKLEQWGSLTPAQGQLAIRVAHDIQNAPANVPAPLGRQTFTGKVVKLTWRDGYGYNAPQVPKIIVKVTTEAGVWLVWLTAPAALMDAKREEGGEIVGATVTLTATLEAGKDAHFAFGKRPTLDDVRWS